jgi:hypothetical protein
VEIPKKECSVREKESETHKDAGKKKTNNG